MVGVSEGNARYQLGDYLHFLGIARGSLAELETQLIIASNLQMLPQTPGLFDQIQEVRRMLQGLIDSLRRKRDGAE